MQPLVSILIPAYNAEKWITQTLQSALAQTWPSKEIIVVDDGSIDGTLAQAREFETRGVRVVTQANRGAAAARNRAFSLSHGGYIQWLDADDLLSPDKIARQMEAAGAGADKRLLLSSAWGSFLYRHRRTVFRPSPLWADLSPVDWLEKKMSQNLHMQTSTWLVSRELTEAAGPWNESLLGDDDGEYFCRVLLASSGVRFVGEAKVYYRASGSSSLSYIGASARKAEAQWRSMQLHIGYLRSLEDSPRVRSACARYLENWLLVFYPDYPGIVAEAEGLAAELGETLAEPRLSWKYAWIRLVFGWRLAKLARIALPNLRWTAARFWDRTMLRLESRAAS